jgi:hypothetical protein
LEGFSMTSEPGDVTPDEGDLDSVRYLIAEMHDDLTGRVQRLRLLANLLETWPGQALFLSGGSATLSAWTEARSSFVYGNYVGTILLCQSLVENLLASFLHASLLVDDLPPRIAFKETLNRCQSHNLVSDEDCRDLERLMSLRNPLSHFRNVNDDQNIDRRALESGLQSNDLLRQDAWFAIGLAVRVLAKPEFQLG